MSKKDEISHNILNIWWNLYEESVHGVYADHIKGIENISSDIVSRFGIAPLQQLARGDRFTLLGIGKTIAGGFEAFVLDQVLPLNALGT